MSEPGMTIAISAAGAVFILALWLVRREALIKGRAKGYWEGYDKGYEDAEAGTWPANVSVSHSPSLSHSPSPSQAVDQDFLDLVLGKPPTGSLSPSPSPVSPLNDFCGTCQAPIYSWDNKNWSHHEQGLDEAHKAWPWVKPSIGPAPPYLRSKCKWCGEQVFSIDDGETWRHAVQEKPTCTDAQGRVHRAKPRG